MRPSRIRTEAGSTPLGVTTRRLRRKKSDGAKDASRQRQS
jgi:hypothetical protein